MDAQGNQNCMILSSPRKSFALSVLLALAFTASSLSLHAQDWVHVTTNLGNAKVRIAAADVKAASADPLTGPLKSAFDQTLYNDLHYAGIFDVVSKSMIPNVTPGSPQEISLPTWAAAPSNAAYVAFGSLAVNAGRLTVQGFLDDTHSTTNPQVLGKQYTDNASVENARTIAHRFADEIIQQLGGIPGIAETKIYFVSARTGHKEIWVMDYDGMN